MRRAHSLGSLLVPFVRNTSTTWLLHALNAVTATVALVCAYVAWRACQRLQGYASEDTPRVTQRMRYTAYIGNWIKLFFFLVMVAESLALYFLDRRISVQ